MESTIAKFVNEEVEALIPDEKEQEKLYATLKRFQDGHNTSQLVLDLRLLANQPQRLPLFEEIRTLIPLRHQIEYDRLVPKRDLDRMRVIRLNRKGSDRLGFSVRGGFEHKVGIYVSEVEDNSVAYRQGLRVGDEIIRLNGFTISQAIHQEALNLIKARSELVLKVRNVGMIPIKSNPLEQVTWKYVDIGAKTSDLQHIEEASRGKVRVGEELQLYINVPVDGGLGCSVCSGPPHKPGIFLQSLKQGGLAQEAALEVGDQIISVNGVQFENITHSQAVVAFKSSKHLDIVIRKGLGLDLFRPRGDPDVSPVEPARSRHPGRSRDVSSPLNILTSNEPLTPLTILDSEVEAHKQEDLLKQVLQSIDKENSPGPSKPSISDTSDQPPPSLASWRFQGSRLEPKSSDIKRQRSSGSSDQGLTTETLVPDTDKGNFPEAEKKQRLYRKNHQREPVYSVATGRQAENRSQQQTPGGADQEQDSPPFPEASTDFGDSPSYDTTIPMSAEDIVHAVAPDIISPPPFPLGVSPPKLLNPKIYRPIEIQTFKDQTTIRPTKSPSYMAEEPGSRYRIQKPVLLHPTHRSEADQQTSPGQPSSGSEITTSGSGLYFTETNFKPDRMFTNEEIAGRKIELITVHKKGCSDLGLVIQANQGQVTVSDVPEGGAVNKNGGITQGDQLMMVDCFSLMGVTVEKAYAILQQEFKTKKPIIQLVVAKAPDYVFPRPDYFDTSKPAPGKFSLRSSNITHF